MALHCVNQFKIWPYVCAICFQKLCWLKITKNQISAYFDSTCLCESDGFCLFFLKIYNSWSINTFSLSMCVYMYIYTHVSITCITLYMYMYTQTTNTQIEDIGSKQSCHLSNWIFKVSLSKLTNDWWMVKKAVCCHEVSLHFLIPFSFVSETELVYICC